MSSEVSGFFLFAIAKPRVVRRGPDPTVTSINMEDDAPSIIGYDLPDGPFKGQRKPPCKMPSVEIRGGCWVPLEYKPPCPISSAEYESKCYMPVSEKKPEPRALLP